MPRDERVENGHDIRKADADDAEKGKRRIKRRHDVDQNETGRADESSERDDISFADFGNDAITHEPAAEHRRRVCGKSDARFRQINPLRFRKENAAPIHDGAFRQKGNTRHDAKDGDEPARHRERFLPAVAAKGKKFRIKIKSERRQERHVNARDAYDGKSGFGQNCIEPATDKASDAPESVHARKNAARGNAFHDDGVEIHRDVERSHRRAEKEKDDEIRPERGKNRDGKDGRRHGKRRADDDVSAAEMPCQNARKRHEKKCRQADGKQQKSQRVRADGEPLLHERNHGRPRGNDESAREKGALRRMNFACTGGKIFEICHIDLLVQGNSSGK